LNDYFVLNRFYEREEIRQKCGLGFWGGIRFNSAQNLLVLFSNAHDDRPTSDYHGNIYKDYYDSAAGLFHYTDEGQKRDQTVSHGNKRLRDAKVDDTRVLFFRQYIPKGKLEYLGLVSVEYQTKEIQKDADGKNRNVVVFWLKLISGPLINDEEAIYREIDSDIETDPRSLSRISKAELDEEITKVSKQIAKQGPKIGKSVLKAKVRYQRLAKIVTLLKARFDDKCQVCSADHFKTKTGVYSEVHHLIPWSVSWDDTQENLVVICANCHRKFHRATDPERRKMFEQLTSNFPNVKFYAPSFLIGT